MTRNKIQEILNAEKIAAGDINMEYSSRCE